MLAVRGQGNALGLGVCVLWRASVGVQRARMRRKGTLVSAPCPLPMGKGVAKSCFGEDTSLDRSGLTHPLVLPSNTKLYRTSAVAVCCGCVLVWRFVLPEQQ